MSLYRWIATNGRFNVGASWANTTLRIVPARTPPGQADTAIFATGGGTITGTGDVAALNVQGGNSQPWLFAATLASGTTFIGGATEVVAGGSWNSGSTTLGTAGSLSVRSDGLWLASSLVMSVGSAFAVSGTGTATVGTTDTAGTPAGVLAVSSTVSGEGRLDAAGGIDDEGTIAAAGGQLLVGAPVFGSGVMQIGAGATLSLAATSTVTVTFTGPGGTLAIRPDDAAASPALTQAGLVVGFAPGQTIHYLGSAPVTLAAATAGQPGESILTLFSNGASLGSLTLAGSLAAFTVTVASDPVSGTDITLAPRVSPDPLFDPGYYLTHNPDVAAAGIDPYLHFLTNGWREGRNPDAWFDTGYYLHQNPDVAAAGLNPLQHFEAFGWMEGRQPSLAFDDARYLAANPDVAAAGVDPLVHFVLNGQNEGRSAFLAGASATASALIDTGFYDRQLGATLIPDAVGAAEQAAWSYDTAGWQQGLNPNAWFDTSYYLRQNPDVAAAGINPLQHFEAFGWTEGRQPSLVFDDGKYLAANPDVSAAQVNPLLSHMLSGQNEGRPTFLTGGTLPGDPLVDAGFYDRQLGATLIPDAAGAAGQAAWSYDAGGWQAGLDPDAWFDTSYYLLHNPDVAAAGINPLMHYEAFGWREGRDPSATFSTTGYLSINPDVRAAGIDPLLHYVAYGQSEGRTIIPAA